MLRFRHLACVLPLLLAVAACTAEEPALPPVTRTVAAPLNQTGPNTPDQRPLAAVQIDHHAGKTKISGSTSLTQGSVVELNILSDVDDQVVIEGLRLGTMLSGGSARLQFTATTPGSFPVRLQGNGTELATLTIT